MARPQRFGKYHVRGELGRGGMGAVFRARDPGTGREVAVGAWELLAEVQEPLGHASEAQETRAAIARIGATPTGDVR